MDPGPTESRQSRDRPHKRVHFVGGVIGTSLIGFLATSTMTGGVEGLLYGGGIAQLGKQLVAIPAVALFAFTVTFVIAKSIDKVIGFRVPTDVEVEGVDLVLHAETAYEQGVPLAALK